MTTSRQAILDNLAAIDAQWPGGMELHWDSERHLAYMDFSHPPHSDPADKGWRGYLCNVKAPALDSTHWNLMVAWEEARYLLDVFDQRGAAAATLHKLGQRVEL